MALLSKIKNRLSYNRWTIGVTDVGRNEIINDDFKMVNWIKHKYSDRFFADPFLLDCNDNEIRILCEEFPYSTDKGVISLLTVDRHTCELKDKRVLLDMPFHQSYPFVLRYEGKIYVLPEASASGNLYAYEWDGCGLINQQVVLAEPMLDSTIIEYNGLWWLFGTKRGSGSNSELYIYYSDNPLSGYKTIKLCPAKKDAATARPGGHMFVKDGILYRLVQKNDNYYGESMYLMRVNELTTDSFSEEIVEILKPKLGEYSQAFHTFDTFGDISVVDGLKTHFSPFKKIYYKIVSRL